ncbi:MAG: ribosomal-protein-alanine N-acetyltransferase [Thermoplasmata archaeon]|nr:MAG: ribosomal-protein-alanine N-acetyltransferase [Thermoplasmata archaeon]
MIRRCEEKDLRAVMEIEKLSFPHPYPLFVFKRYLNTYFFVSEENGEVIGYIIGIKMGSKGIIISIAVHPSFRRRGHGKDLIKHVEKEMGTSILEIQVRRSNVGAQKFYLSLGFEKKEIIPNYYHNGEDAFVMIKKLS